MSMGKDCNLTILYLKSVDSTQKYLKQKILSENIPSYYVVVSDIQTNGIGSRENSWIGIEGNLFLSFAIDISNLPKDLKLESCSIYFAYLLKETLSEFGSSLWLKWPNDFYIDNCKIGGAITNILKDKVVCGIGLNLVHAPKEFKRLDINISRDIVLEAFMKKIEKKLSWKQVFSKYELEFHKNHKFFTHSNDIKISLSDVKLQDDGSILKNGERIYSLR